MAIGDVVEVEAHPSNAALPEIKVHAFVARLALPSELHELLHLIAKRGSRRD